MTALLLPPDPDLDFELPEELVATRPPEASGRGRDDVRLLVTTQHDGGLVHAAFTELPRFLRPGDLLVINTSATLPAAIPTAERLVHLSTPLPGGLWVVELRRPAGAGTLPDPDGRAGERLALPGGGAVELLAPYPANASPSPSGTRLWFASLRLPRGVQRYLAEHGRPIRYGYATDAWPLSAYQTVYATEPGSAEMPSAGRAFTPQLITELVAHGVRVAPLVLHAGVSSQESGEPPYPEPYRVPAETAAQVNWTRAAGGRVVAVGTTVTRALETVADDSGQAHPGAGWTELVITAERGLRVIDGLLTGWHLPRSSHLELLSAVTGRPLLRRAYAAAVASGYRWHEFGDLHLLLP